MSDEPTTAAPDGRTTPPAPTETTAARRPSKKLLERRKLELEIVDLERSPWRKPAVVIPLAATLVTLGLSWWLGVFDVARQRNEVARDRAQIEVERLTTQQKELQSSKSALNVELADLKKKVAAGEGELATIRGRLKQATDIVAVPVLEVHETILDSRVAIDLRNGSRADALVRRLQVFVSNKNLARGPVGGGAWWPALDALRLRYDWVNFTWPAEDGRLRPGEGLDLLWINAQDVSAARTAEFRGKTAELGLEICYCSLQNQCKWLSWRRPEVRKTACE